MRAGKTQCTGISRTGERCQRPAMTGKDVCNSHGGKPTCTAHSRQTKEPCRYMPIHGGTVCKYHGGRNGRTKIAAERRLAVIRIREELASIVPDPVDPVAALMEQLALSYAWERWMRTEVANTASLDDKGVGGSRQVAVVYDLWKDERERIVKFSKMALDAGVAERQVQIAERHGGLVAQLLRTLIDDPELGLDSAGRERGRQIAARHLRLLTA